MPRHFFRYTTTRKNYPNNQSCSLYLIILSKKKVGFWANLVLQSILCFEVAKHIPRMTEHQTHKIQGKWGYSPRVCLVHTTNVPYIRRDTWRCPRNLGHSTLFYSSTITTRRYPKASNITKKMAKLNKDQKTGHPSQTLLVISNELGG